MPAKSTKVGFVNPESLISQGPTIMVRVGLDYDTYPDPNLDTMTSPVYALIDTGASNTCIDKTLAVQIGLPIHGEPFLIAGISGPETVNIHLGQIHIPALGETLSGLFPVVDLAGGGQHHKVLMGRDFLKSCKMFYDGTTGDVQIDLLQTT